MPGEWAERLLKERERRVRNAIFCIGAPALVGFVLSYNGWLALVIGLAISLNFALVYGLMEWRTVDPERLLRDGMEIHASIVRSTGSAPGHSHLLYGEQFNFYFEVDGDPVMRTLGISEQNQARHVNLPNDAPGIVLLVHPDDPWSPFVVPKA